MGIGDSYHSQKQSLPPGWKELWDAQISLARACADVLDKVVRQLQGEDSWALGAMPPCLALVDELEAKTRAVLANSQLSPGQSSQLSHFLKAAGDFRVLARAGLQLAQIAWLIRETRGDDEAVRLVLTVAQPAQRLSQTAVTALVDQNAKLMRNAALMFRAVDTACGQAETLLCSGSAFVTMEPRAVRMARAGVWFSTIAGESFARVVARLVEEKG